MYISVHYVMIDGRCYTPGEVIDREIDEKKRDRLLSLGAIRTVAPAPAAVKTAGAPVMPEPEAEDAAAEDETVSGYEDGEAPEIDVMDGLIADEPEPRPAPKGRRRSR